MGMDLEQRMRFGIKVWEFVVLPRFVQFARWQIGPMPNISLAGGQRPQETASVPTSHESDMPTRCSTRLSFGSRGVRDADTRYGMH